MEKKNPEANEKKSGISRRDFMKGAAGGAAALAAASVLSGCTTTGAAGGSTGSVSANGLMTAEKAANMKWNFEIAPKPVSESKISKTYTHDVVVIGAGLSGLCTMCSALESGADAVMFSASSKPIGRGGSNHAIGSKYQKEMGIEYTPEIAREIVKTEQTSGTYFMDKQKWAKWINNSAEAVDWMIDKMEAKGLKTSLEAGYYDPDGVLTVPHASHNFFTDEQPLGVFFGAPLQAKAYAEHIKDMGGEIHFKTIAQYLIRENDNTGRVSAVVAKTEDGSYVKYVARKAVVLATGDFSRDKDMLAKYSPWAYGLFKDKLAAEPNYDAEMTFDGLMPGDGQKMGLWVGAGWQRTFPNAPVINGGAAGPSHAIISNFWGCNLDVNGKRYQNECTNFAYGAMSVLQLPKQTAFGIWDAGYAYTQEEWEPLGYTIGQVNGIKPLSPEEYLESWKNNPSFIKADTIEDLVAQLDMDDEGKKNALESIKNYTRYAEQGYDEEFQVNPKILFPIKQGPFFASKTVGATFLAVTGGLRTNTDLQVCDADDNPIEGLYNTGTMVGDFYANSYNFVMPGQNLGALCCTLSYMLGRDLAAL